MSKCHIVRNHMSRLNFCVQQNQGRRFGTSKIHLSPPKVYAAVSSKAAVLLMLILYLLLLPLWGFVFVPCFVVQYFVSSLFCKERDGIFTFIVSMISCDCYCFVAVPHVAMCWSVVLIVIFSDQTRLIF